MNEAGANILVVDDDPFTAELTAMVLEMSGYNTIIAEGGPDALEKMAGDTTIRAVVSDMYMPLIDGVQLFEELRRQDFRQPFVLLTGQEADPLRAAHPDIDAILTKDEQLQETLPETLASLFESSKKDEQS